MEEAVSQATEGTFMPVTAGAGSGVELARARLTTDSGLSPVPKSCTKAETMAI